MYISLSNGTVLTVFPNGRSIVEIKKEVSERIANVGTSGNLLDRNLHTMASFDYQGREIVAPRVMVLTDQENAGLCQMIADLELSDVPRLEEFTPTMNIYHYQAVKIHVRRCDSWTWIEAFNKSGRHGKTIKSVRIDF